MTHPVSPWDAARGRLYHAEGRLGPGKAEKKEGGWASIGVRERRPGGSAFAEYREYQLQLDLRAVKMKYHRAGFRSTPMRASPLLSVVFLTGCIPPPTPHAPPQLEDDGTPRTPGLATKVAAHPLWRAKVAEAQMEELVDQVRRTQPGGFVVVDDQFHTYTWRDITSLPVGGKPRIAACGSDRPLSLPDRIGDPFISIGGWDCCPARDVVLGTLLQCMNQVESKRAN